MLNIVLFGPPGAGKGTQSEKLINKYNLVHISTGDLLRNEIANNTELGSAAKNLIDHGLLVPDEIVIGMVQNKLSANIAAPGFIFDGFPRTVAQASALDGLLEELGTSITLMIELDVDTDELIRRLVRRGETSGRADDNEQTALKRIEVYNNETRPVAEFYKSQEKFYKINGFGGIDEIFNRLTTVINREFSMNSI
jgi:adenylate kinase